MANSKIFRKAQQRSSSGGSKLTGFVGFREAIEVIKDTQVRNVEPYGLLAEVAKNLKPCTCPIHVTKCSNCGEINCAGCDF